MITVLTVLSFVCLAAAEPHYSYNPPKGGAVALHGFPVPVVAPPLAPFLAIRHDAQRPIRPSVPFHTGIVPIAQPLPPYFAIRDVQVPIKQVKDTKPQPVIPSPFFSSFFVPHPPFFAIRDVQVPRVPVAEEEIEDNDSDEVVGAPQVMPVVQGTLPPFLAVQHDAQTPIKVEDGFIQNIFGFHTDIAYGPPIVDFGNIRTPAVTITNDIPVPVKAPAASFAAIHNQQVPVRGTLAGVVSAGEDMENVELVGTDTTSTSQESGMQGPIYVKVAYFPNQIANIFDTRETNPDDEIHAPAGIVQSTQPIFTWTPFINAKAHEDIRPFRNSKAHPDTHRGPNEDSVATHFH